MERYEFKDGSSLKFWEVAVEGDKLTVCFGKIGTSGQTKEKTFADAAAAEKEKTKLVKEKTGKGYVATGASATSPPVAPAAKPAKAPVARKPPSAAPATGPAKPHSDASSSEPPTTARASTSPAKAPVLPAPTGERLVTDEPLPTRMRPAKAHPADEAWAAFAHGLTELAAKAANKDEWPLSIVADTPPASLTPKAAADWSLTLHTVARAAPSGQGYNVRENWGAFLAVYQHFADWLVAAHGAVFAVKSLDALAFAEHRTTSHYGNSAWSLLPYIAFRSAISSAPQSDYDAAIAYGLESSTSDWDRDVRVAFVLADDRLEPHALQGLAVLERVASLGFDIGATSALVPLIAEAPSALAKPWRVKRTYFFYYVYFLVSAGQIAATAASAAASRRESALPVLDWLLHYATDDDRTTLACAILDTHEDDALATLVPLMHEKPVRAALDKASEAYPGWMFQRTLALLGTRAEPALRARALKAMEAHGAEMTRAWASALGGRGEKYYESLVGQTSQAKAEAHDLPSFLRTPPWRAGKKASTDIVVQLVPIKTALVFKNDGKRHGESGWAYEILSELVSFIDRTEKQNSAYTWVKVEPPLEPVPTESDTEQHVRTWLSRRIDQFASVRRYSGVGGYASLFNTVDRLPDPLALLLWEKPTAMHLGYGINWPSRITTMLSRFGETAVPGLVKNVEAEPTEMLPIVKDIGTPSLAPVAARAFMKLKKARAPGRAWLQAHPRAALLRLVPMAVGPLGAPRDIAEYAVRWFKTEKPNVLDVVVAEYAAIDPQVTAAIAQVLARDPFARTPSKVGKMPSWLSLSSLTRPELKAGGVLPDDAMTALIEMLSFVNPEDLYAGVPALREACTPDSLAAFAWDLFSAWLANGAPSKEGWAFRTLGWFGNDQCARDLTRLIRKWPGEAAHARAVTGLDILADIGSDVALMNLNGIAEKAKFKGLQDRARDKIAVIAEARDLSAEELADRLVPDLDLDARGGLDLDFGPRRFRAGFDEFLKPWVKDETGKRLKDLPKPIKSDDAEKSAEASAQWSALKKDARAIASLQLTRLENMLATGRRTNGEVFQTFFAAHPLIRNLAQRLVWGVYDTDAVDTAPRVYFRVTEDLSFTDADDNPVTIDVGAESTGLIGLAHPLHMSAADQTKWGSLFGDYEIAQPFAQLGRETYTLTDVEKADTALKRFEGREVESKRLRGMATRGWRTGQPQDGGGISWIERSVTLVDGTKTMALLEFEEGLYAGAASEEPTNQTLHTITLGTNTWTRQDAQRLAALDAITASEIVRAITLLVEAGAS
jgi:predicted DNA-binding WGR domain protein